MGAAGVDALRRQLEDPDGATPHAVTAPAEDDSVDPPGENSLQQHLSLFLVKEPAHEKMHSVGRSYQETTDKTPETQLRKCATRLGRLDLVDLCREDEVVVGESAGGVGPQVDA